MSFRKRFYNLLFLLFFCCYFCSCTKEYVPLHRVHEDSLIEKKNALIVFEVQFVETFNDPQTEKLVEIQSERLFQNVPTQTIDKLNDPAYYLSNFRFLFGELKDEENGFETVHFHLKPKSYETVSIYALKPTRVQLFKIIHDIKTFRDSKPDRPPVRWHQSKRWYETDFPEWKVEQGKILYLGSFTFFFETQKFQFGVLPRETLVKEVRLKRISIQDQLQEVKLKLFRQKPWFPTKKIVSVAKEQEWAFEAGNFKLVDKSYFKVDKKSKRWVEPVKRSKENYFF